MKEIFNGQCRIDFEEWYSNNYGAFSAKHYNVISRLTFFHALPIEFKSGVYIAFADSVGYYILPDKVGDIWEGFLLTTKRELVVASEPSRQETITAALEKFNEIYNNETIT